MPFLLRGLTLSPGDSEELLRRQLLRRFTLAEGELLRWAVVRKGVDARRKPRVLLVYTVGFSVADEAAFLQRHGSDPDLTAVPEPAPLVFPQLRSDRRIVIVGSGPAGLFAALRLVDHGLTATLLERGRPVEERVRDVQRFWSRGELDPESNVQFGEGGAGTFSDGKLTTRVRDDNIGYVLEQLVRFGAPPEIGWLAKPHVGTDRLRGVVTAIRRHLQESGCAVRFGAKLTDIVPVVGRVAAVTVNGAQELPCDDLVLAPGHSARDTYRLLRERGVRLEPKPFAVGLRVEHPQELIDRLQFGAVPRHPALPPADYGLAWNDPASGRAAYSFCMCPGGVVIGGSSEAGGVVTNGMSGYRRDALFANSALVVTVRVEDFPGNDPLAGIDFQRNLEQRAFAAGGGDYRAPAQNLRSFLAGTPGGKVTASYRPGVREADLAELLPPWATATLRAGIRAFDRRMRGFVTGEACLIGVESRTSAPLRIVRGGDGQSVTLPGLYPAGEGAGYAGGIMSAALDGIRAADAIVRTIMES